MSLEDRALSALDLIARKLNERNPQAAVSMVREALKERVERASVRVLDGIVSRIAGHPVRTLPRIRLGGWLLPTAAEPTPVPSMVPTPSSEPLPSVAPTPSLAPPPSVPPRARVSRHPTQPPPAHSERPLPARFGIDRIVLLVREANLGFAYWEISRERLSALGAETLQLQLLDVDEAQCVYQQVVPGDQGRSYLPGLRSGHRYQAQLVLQTADPKVVSSSRIVEAPAKP